MCSGKNDVVRIHSNHWLVTKSLTTHHQVTIDKVLTRKLFKSLDDFVPPVLHRDPVLTHHKTKHHKGDELTGVRLKSE